MGFGRPVRYPWHPILPWVGLSFCPVPGLMQRSPVPACESGVHADQFRTLGERPFPAFNDDRTDSADSFGFRSVLATGGEEQAGVHAETRRTVTPHHRLLTSHMLPTNM